VRAHGAGMLAYMWPRPGAAQPVPKLSYVKGFAPWGWIIGTGVYVDDLDAARWRLAETLAGVGLVTMLVIGGIVWQLGRSVSRPLALLSRATGALAGGDLSVDLPSAERHDELGTLARTLTTLRDAARERAELAVEVARQHGLQSRRQAAMDRHTEDFGRSISGVLASLEEVSTEMRNAAAAMADTARQTRGRAAETADGARESAANLAATAASVEEMSASIGEISAQAARASGAVRAAIARVDVTNGKVTDMAETAVRIGDVVKMIAEIAARTNLLALNATIEAARAGEAGRGFAVVAGEVKGLATQTARATDEIGAQVSRIHAAMGEAVEASGHVGAAVREIDTVATAIAAAVEQQAAAMREIAQTVNAITVATTGATEAMQVVSGLAQEADAGTRDVTTTAGSVAETSGTLRREVDLFLDAMSKTDAHDRRGYERVAGNGARTGLAIAGAAPVEVEIVDISRGGLLLDHNCAARVGTTAQVSLPGAPRAVAARVVRLGERRLVVSFVQEPAALAIIDAAITEIERRGTQAAA